MSEKLLLNVLKNKKNENQKIPVWLMRQAGRYLPEYREIRKTTPTLKMFKSPKIATEVTLQPLRRFNLDGAILYADILLIPDALGLELSFIEKEGPKFNHTIRNFDDFDKFLAHAETLSVIKNLGYVFETVENVTKELPGHVTMLGFAGAPFTVASYMIEGGSSSKSDFFETKKVMNQNPELFHAIMDKLTVLTIEYLMMQIKSGAQAVQIFDSWSGALSHKDYATFCIPYIQKIICEIKKHVPVILFLGTTAHIIDDVVNKTTPNALSIDWRVNFKKVSHMCREKDIVLQGNLDPLTLYGNKNTLEVKIKDCCKMGLEHSCGYIFNLGHGLTQHTPVEAVEFLVNTVKNYEQN